MNDVIEFHIDGNGVCTIHSSMVPAVGDFISIKKQTYSVTAVTYAIDDSEMTIQSRTMRCNVDLKKAHP